MNRRSFFGIFALPLAPTISPPAQAEGQPAHVVNNSADVLLGKIRAVGDSTTLTIGTTAYTWSGGHGG